MTTGEAPGGERGWISPAEEPAGGGDFGDPLFLDARTWNAFHHAASLVDVAQAWLVLQCALIEEHNLSAVLLMTSARGQPLLPVAVWPIDAPAASALLKTAEAASREARGLLSTAGGIIVAHPLILDMPMRGAVALHLPAADGPRGLAVMRQLQWGLGLLADRLRARDQAAYEMGVGRSTIVLDVLALVLQTERAKAAASAAVTELASRLACDRVSIGNRRRNRTIVGVISHTANFGQQMSLVRLLGAAMDEAVDQRAVIAFPPLDADEPLATRDHSELSMALSGAHVLSVPMLLHGEFHGAITFERPADRPFLQPEVEVMAALGAALGPVLEEKRLNDRWLVTKIAVAFQRGF
jgi:hypothetical protein